MAGARAAIATWNRTCQTARVIDGLRIEPATLDDLPELTEMLFELFSQEQDFVPNREKQMRGLRFLLEAPSRGRIFVLRSQNRIIGMINLLITISTAEGGFVLLLEDLIVDRAHRGQGYGTKLLNYAIEFAKKKNFLRITLLTDQPDEPHKHIYLKNGFVQSAMVPMRMYFHKNES
ncbi:MAG: GNAT family N-acetyltransferase [Verrucomicrobiota bacterium]